jgi:hypothetical protein
MPSTRVAVKRMGMPEVRLKAKALGLKHGNMKKPDLIRAIQMVEGYTPCFGRSNGQCIHTDCCFMPDCLAPKR